MTNREAIEILKQIREDYEGNGNVLADGNEALNLAIKALESIDHVEAEKGRIESLKKANERIKSLELAFEQQRQLTESCKRDNDILWKELEESRAKEGKGALETVIESIGQLVASLNEALQGMTPEEIRELLRPDEEEEEEIT